MNHFLRTRLRSTGIVLAYLLGLTLVCFCSASAQVPSRDRANPRAGVSKASLPDLSVAAAGPMGQNEKDGLKVVVIVQNKGNSASASVDVPFKVWLRIWKPTDTKSAEGPTAGKNSFIWGGVQIVNGVKQGELPNIYFYIPATPPGGWRMKCHFGGCGRDPESLKDPLRWRVSVVVDSANVIKESNETNNSYVN